jgi:tRNA modification GTPase
MDPRRSREVVVAAATPAGRGAVAIVRLTGGGALQVLDKVAKAHRSGPWRPGRVRRASYRDAAGVFDDGLVTTFAGPKSYTGEDLVELSLHGNPELVSRLVHACVEAGARVADPGEFTRRAVVAGRMELLHAEAIDQLVRASGPEGVRIARDALSGRLGGAFDDIRSSLLQVAAELEARLDWADDDLAYETDERLFEMLKGTAARCRSLGESYRAGRARVDGLKVAIVGPVNAGKSSLFNRLVGEERAIVHASPGTTRDVVEARTRVGGFEITLFDTAGERPTDDPIEAMGLQLARRVVEEADLLLVVARARDGGPDAVEQALLARTASRERLVVTNRVDEGGRQLDGSIATSAVTGQGLPELQRALEAALGAAPADGLMVASARQRDLLLAIAEACDRARDAMPVAGVAVAADAVIGGLEEIDRLTGASTREDVLDVVFAKFCIGK